MHIMHFKLIFSELALVEIQRASLYHLTDSVLQIDNLCVKLKKNNIYEQCLAVRNSCLTNFQNMQFHRETQIVLTESVMNMIFCLINKHKKFFNDIKVALNLKTNNIYYYAVTGSFDIYIKKDAETDNIQLDIGIILILILCLL